MKSIVVLSGKGGVGKSIITSALAISFSKDEKIVCVDCDVDAANLSILFSSSKKKFIKKNLISTNKKPSIDNNLCVGCNECVNACYFDALNFKDKTLKVNDFGCEGCGVCELVCKYNAIKLKKIDNAYIGFLKTKYNFKIVSAQLFPGSSGSGKVVYEVKKKAKEIEKKANLMLIDSSAGIGCPVIASISGSDYAILVTEPSPSGFEDLKRALKIVNHFKIKKGIIINKYDLNFGFSKKIENFANENNVDLLYKIPFDTAFVKAITKTVSIIDYKKEYINIFNSIKEKVKKTI
ncbi:MAG: P-loop NTPase [Candidatus Woesearchaeota archaeon]